MNGVFDTVILVRGLINPFSWSGRLLFDYFNEYDLVVTPAIIAEYLDVVNRDELIRKYHATEDRDIAFVLNLIENATMVQPTDNPAVCRDPEDDKFLAAALAGDAGHIVSEDLDLLDLGTYEGIDILSARAFIEILDRERN